MQSVKLRFYKVPDAAASNVLSMSPTKSRIGRRAQITFRTKRSSMYFHVL